MLNDDGMGDTVTLAFHAQQGARAGWARVCFLGCFFLSGCAGLIYQVIWQRMLTLFGGADIHSVTIIVSAFMAGLGLGSIAGGYWADRLRRQACIAAFVGCECAVAVFALFSTTIYYDLLYVRLGALALPSVALGGVVFLVTLWPTFFMGMSLPLAVKAFADDPRQPARWVPVLYGWNTLGAACGALLSVGVLFPWIGLIGGLRFGAALSLACALTALCLSPHLQRRADAEDGSGGPASLTSEPSRFSQPAWMAMYLLSGFVAMSLEVVWFRVLGVILKSTSSTFGCLLAVYVTGVGAGSLLATGSRVRRWRPVSAFLRIQAVIPLCAALSLTILIGAIGVLGDRRSHGDAQPVVATTEHSTATPVDGGPPPPVEESRRLQWDSLPRPLAVAVWLVIPLWLIGPATLMMGFSFGLLQHAVQTDVRVLGRRLGLLQAANIAGAVVGTLATGFVLLDWIGTPGTLRLLVCCSAAFLWMHVRTLRSGEGRLRAAVLSAAAVIAITWLIPSGPAFWARLHAAPLQTVIVREDGSGVSLLRTYLDSGQTQVYANGLGQSRLPYGGVHTILGALPALLHPSPEAVAVVGLGSGDTLFSLGGRPETRSIDSIEIVGAEFETLRELDRRQLYPALGLMLRDPRIRHVFTDARAFLRRSDRAFDVIEADALMPTRAYAGNLYSVEYFELLRGRLKPGGLAVSWAPTDRVRDSMIQVFPYVLVFDEMVIGSMSRVPFDRPTIVARMHASFTRGYYSSGGIDLDALMAPVLEEVPREYRPDFDRSTLPDLNRDLFPRDEFGIPYHGQAGS